MQRRKSTKDTRNAAYKQLKQQFDLYVEFNSVSQRDLREARKAAEALERERDKLAAEKGEFETELKGIKDLIGLVVACTTDDWVREQFRGIR